MFSNRILAKTKALGDKLPVAADHPIKGGIAPTMLPIQVFIMLTRLRGV